MAVAARPPVAGNPTSLKAGLVVFVALTVVSLGLLIWLYTGQTELVQTAEAAKKQAQTARQQEQESRAALQALAFRALGKQTDDPSEIDAALDTSLAGVFGKDDSRLTDAQRQLVAEAGIKRSDPLVTTLQGLHQGLVNKSEALQELQAENKRMSDELAAGTEKLKTTQDEFADEADKIKDQLAELEKQMADHRAAWEESVARLRRQGEAEADRASEQLASERSQRQDLEKQLAQNKSRIDELVATLATFRPSAESTSLLQISDGQVVQTVPDQRIVYISLGKRDHIKPGMSFAVYSRVRGIPPDGEGKATIKVNNVFDATSECEITTSNVGDPIVDGDVIANPVYDRDRKFNFVVAGDFDLDFDGKIDDPDGEQVRRMIEEWGGNLQPSVDTRTDFVVLGASPVVFSALPAGEDNATGAAQARHAEAVKKFQTALQEARALGIPVLTRTQFLHFIGFGVPRNAKDDQGPI